MPDALNGAADRARTWLFETALPLWLGEGFDGARAPFAERIGEDGKAVHMNRRLRVQARQTYVCAEAGALGWPGDWRTPLEAGVALLTGSGRRDDCAFVHLLSPGGEILDRRADLYDHAFALFALASAAPLLARPDLEAIIEDGWQWLDANWKHPEGGYREGEIESADIRRQNPHMHLLEAAMGLHAAFPSSSGLERARELATLFRTRFYDEEHGALPEFFDQQWRRLPDDRGRVTEPGHQFEWAWLLRRYADAAGDDSVRPIAERLIAHGRSNGLDATRGVAINEVWIEGQAKTATARLWPQTERIKAAVSGLSLNPASEALEAVAALDGLFRFLDDPVPGAWRDMMEVDNSLRIEAAPASSLYHIVCAMAELIRAAENERGPA